MYLTEEKTLWDRKKLLRLLFSPFPTMFQKSCFLRVLEQNNPAFSPFPKQQILDTSELKSLYMTISNLMEMAQCSPNRYKKEKLLIISNILLFPQSFQKIFIADMQKQRLVSERINNLYTEVKEIIILCKTMSAWMHLTLINPFPHNDTF